MHFQMKRLHKQVRLMEGKSKTRGGRARLEWIDADDGSGRVHRDLI